MRQRIEFQNIKPELQNTGTFGNIPTKILKILSDICNLIVQNIVNPELLEN